MCTNHNRTDDSVDSIKIERVNKREINEFSQEFQIVTTSKKLVKPFEYLENN